MYVVFNINYIHHLLNKPKMLNFAYNNERGCTTNVKLVQLVAVNFFYYLTKEIEN